jgi:hypothetical protein
MNMMKVVLVLSTENVSKRGGMIVRGEKEFKAKLLLNPQVYLLILGRISIESNSVFL